MNVESEKSEEQHKKLFIELALLSPVEYDNQRVSVAKEFKIRLSTLDALVDAERPQPDEGSDSDELTSGVVPWHEPVDGADLANRMEAVIKRYCVLSDHSITASFLWIIASYKINAFRIFAKLGVTSPQKRCGKTTFLETTAAMCNRAILSSNLTGSVLFRVIEEWQPTLIIDEMDTFIESNEELRGIINSSHNRKLAYAMRVEGDANTRKPRKFSTWTAMILAKIGIWPDTLKDRIIAIYLERKLANDSVERVPANLDDQCLSLRQQCQRWVNDNEVRLTSFVPAIPKMGSDRAEDNWLPLLSVADLIGAGWPEKARSAMMDIESKDSRDESDDLSIMLLRDIKMLCNKHRWKDVIHSGKLVEQLNELHERPWPTLRNDRGLSQHKLAAMLKPFNLRSGSKRDPTTNQNLKGYSISKLNEVFERYLSSDNPIQTVTASQSHKNAPLSEFQSVTADHSVTDAISLEASKNGACDVVTLSRGLRAEKHRTGCSSNGNLTPAGRLDHS